MIPTTDDMLAYRQERKMGDYKLITFELTPEMVEAAEEAYMPFGDMDLAVRMAILVAPDVQGEKPRRYPIGPLTYEKVFKAAGLTDLSDMQAVLDAVEAALSASAAPAVQGEPSLVAWVLYDATADQKYIKMSDRDESLAIFDSEAAARRAKFLHPGTDYKRCEYYTAPQPAEQKPAPDVAGLVEALESAKNLIANHSGEVLPDEYAGDQIEQIDDLLAAYRKGGEV